MRLVRRPELRLKRPPRKSGRQTRTTSAPPGPCRRRRSQQWRDRAPDQGRTELLQNRVFKGLGRAKANHRLGLNLNRFTGCRIAAHARPAVRFYGATQTGDHEFSVALGFFYGKLEKFIEKRSNLLF